MLGFVPGSLMGDGGVPSKRRGLWRAVLWGCLSTKSNPLRSADCPLYSAAWRGLCTLLVLSAPLCYALVYFEMHCTLTILPKYVGEKQIFASWPIPLAEAIMVVCFPYLLWVLVVFGLHWLAFKACRRPIPPRRALWCAAAGFPLSYYCVWSIPASVPFIEIILVFTWFWDWENREILLWFERLGTWIPACVGLILLAVGVRNNVRGWQPEAGAAPAPP